MNIIDNENKTTSINRNWTCAVSIANGLAGSVAVDLCARIKVRMSVGDNKSIELLHK